jgi:hypothetical protein
LFNECIGLWVLKNSIRVSSFGRDPCGDPEISAA